VDHTAQLQQIVSKAGTTKLISLKIENEKHPRNVFIREIQKQASTGDLIHVDFYQIRKSEKIKVEVPIVLVGEAPALKSRENMLLQELNSLSIECLPDQIPASIELDLSSLTEAEQAIHVRDITLDEGVTVLNDPQHMVVKISLRHVEKVEEEVAVEEAVEAPEAVQSPEEKSKEE